MASSLFQQKVHAFIDPRMDLVGSELPERIAVIGAQYSVPIKVNRQEQSTDIQSSTWTVPVPAGSLLSRECLWHQKYRVTLVTTAAAAAPIFVAGQIAPRSFCSHGITSALTPVINGVPFPTNPRQYNAAQRLIGGSQIQQYGSTTGYMFDNSQSYADLADSNRNVLADANSSGSDLMRGAYLEVLSAGVCNITGGAVGTPCVLQFSSDELLECSPFSYAGNQKNHKSLAHVSSLVITAIYNNVERVLSGYLSAGQTLVSCTVEILESQLKLMAYTPKLSSEYTAIPPEVSYPFWSMQTSQTNSTGNIEPSLVRGAIAPFALAKVPTPITSAVMSLDSVPDKILVFAQRATVDYNTPIGRINEPDCFLPIVGMSVQFGTTPGIFAGLGVAELFNIAASDGFCRGFLEYAGYATDATAAGAVNGQYGTSGGVFCWTPGTGAHSLPDGVSVGSGGRWDLQITAMLEDNRAVAIPAVLTVIAFYSGSVTMSSTNAVLNRLTMSNAEVLDAKVVEGPEPSDSLSGEGIMDSFRHALAFTKKLGRHAKQALNSIPDSVLAGEGARTGGAARGGDIAGGRVLNRKALRTRK